VAARHAARRWVLHTITPAAAIALAALPSGCCTAAGLFFDGPRVYGGVRFNLGVQGEIYRGDVALERWEWFTWPPLFILDFPLSLTADTLILPVTAPLAVRRSS
jgi:uncharacterized protein YceK